MGHYARIEIDWFLLFEDHNAFVRSISNTAMHCQLVEWD
jgi:hypothetical protein